MSGRGCSGDRPAICVTAGRFWLCPGLRSGQAGPLTKATVTPWLPVPGTPARCTESHSHVVGEPTVRIYEMVLRIMRVRTPLGRLAACLEAEPLNPGGKPIA